MMYCPFQFLRRLSTVLQVYLVDYGLAYRYTVGAEHKDYKEDPKRAHDGTIEFTSRDAHKGLGTCQCRTMLLFLYTSFGQDEAVSP